MNASSGPALPLFADDFYLVLAPPWGTQTDVDAPGAERISESRGTAAPGTGRRAAAPSPDGTPVQLLLPSQLLTAARSNRPRARARLVETFLPLIITVARSYRSVPGVDRAELVQEGVVGLLRALERYDQRLGTPFWAYASWWVREAMQQVVSELSRPVVLSDRALRQLSRARAARRDLARANGREPSANELARASGLSVRQLHKLLAVEQCPRALQQTVEGRRAGNEATIGELVTDPRAEDAFDELAIRLTATQVPRLLEALSEREQSVIKARYGLAGRQRSLRELGQTMGVSAERVRQIEEGALRTMRAACTQELAPTRGREWPAGPTKRPRRRRRGSRTTHMETRAPVHTTA